MSLESRIIPSAANGTDDRTGRKGSALHTNKDEHANAPRPGTSRRDPEEEEEDKKTTRHQLASHPLRRTGNARSGSPPTTQRKHTPERIRMSFFELQQQTRSAASAEAPPESEALARCPQAQSDEDLRGRVSHSSQHQFARHLTVIARPQSRAANHQQSRRRSPDAHRSRQPSQHHVEHGLEHVDFHHDISHHREHGGHHHGHRHTHTHHRTDHDSNSARTGIKSEGMEGDSAMWERREKSVDESIHHMHRRNRSKERTGEVGAGGSTRFASAQTHSHHIQPAALTAEVVVLSSS